jgi:hypothetical protein
MNFPPSIGTHQVTQQSKTAGGLQQPLQQCKAAATRTQSHASRVSQHHFKKKPAGSRSQNVLQENQESNGSQHPGQADSGTQLPLKKNLVGSGLQHVPLQPSQNAVGSQSIPPQSTTAIGAQSLTRKSSMPFGAHHMPKAQRKLKHSSYCGRAAPQWEHSTSHSRAQWHWEHSTSHSRSALQLEHSTCCNRSWLPVDLSQSKMEWEYSTSHNIAVRLRAWSTNRSRSWLPVDHSTSCNRSWLPVDRSNHHSSVLLPVYQETFRYGMVPNFV